MRIAVTGGTGFIGKVVVKRLLDAGLETVVLSRDPVKAAFQVDRRARCAPWSASMSPEELAEAIEGCAAIVHLAGENVGAGRWTESRKRALVESRTIGTQTLVQAISRMNEKPRTLVAASAVGFYGDRGDELLDESSAPGAGFLTDLCIAWEAAARQAEKLGVRVVSLRIGMAVGRGGGALEKMALPFRMFAGGHIGSGNQWVPWVHVEDVAGLVMFALNNAGAPSVMNVCAPEPVQLKTFCRELGRVMNRPSWFPVPGFVLKTALGEQSTIVLSSTRAEPKAALSAGYTFRFPDVSSALREAVS